MKTRIKLSLTSLLLLLAASIMGIYFSTSSVTIASADSTYSGSGTFEMVNTVNIKEDEDGFAFNALIDKTTYDNLGANEGVYFIVIPTKYKATLAANGNKYYQTIKRVATEGEDYGEYDAESSYCVYVKAKATDNGDGNYKLFGGITGGVALSHERESYFAVACIETKNDTRDGAGNGSLTFTYTYANKADGAAEYPECTLYNAVNTVMINTDTDVSVFDEVYSWYGTENYPINVNSLAKYNAFIARLNGGLDIAGKQISIADDYASDEGATEIDTSVVSLYSVKFEDANGDAFKAYTVTGGSKITAPTTNPTKNADHYTYSFNEWQKGGSAFDFDDEISADTVISPDYTESINYTLSLDSSSAKIYYDTTDGTGLFDLNATHTIVPSISVTDDYDDVTYTFESSATDVATVSDAGVITSASNQGSATITVTLTDNGTGETLSETVAVTNVKYYECSDSVAIESDTTGYYKLVGDIDFAGATSGFSATDFKGVLDGNGYAIKNLKGQLFKNIGGATVKNIAFIDASRKQDEGTLAYQPSATTVIQNVLITTTNEYRLTRSGGIFYVLWSDVTLKDVVMVAKTKSEDVTDIGYIAGCAKTDYKVINDNCYYVLIPNNGSGGTYLPIGLRTDYINSADDSNAAMTGTFETYSTVSAFTADNSIETLTMYEKYVNNRNFIAIDEASDFENISSGSTNYYYLTNDIDFEGATSGSSATSFAGVLDGRGYAIKNLNGQLFSKIAKATIKDIALINSRKKSGEGILAYNGSSSAIIKNVLVTTDGAGYSLSGGLFRQSLDSITLDDVVMITSSNRGSSDHGYIAGFMTSGKTVTNNNCYYIASKTSGTYLPIGLRSGYINSADDSNAAMTGTYTTYTNLAGFENDSDKTLSSKVSAMYDKYVAVS